MLDLPLCLVIYLCVLRSIGREWSEDKAWRTQPQRRHLRWRHDQFSAALHLLLNLRHKKNKHKQIKAPCAVVTESVGNSLRVPGMVAKWCSSVSSKVTLMSSFLFMHSCSNSNEHFAWWHQKGEFLEQKTPITFWQLSHYSVSDQFCKCENSKCHTLTRIQI